jgi:hypothetical protein
MSSYNFRMLLAVLILSFLQFSTTQAQECGTPIECYEKALAGLVLAQQAFEAKTAELESQITILQTQVAALSTQNTELQGRVSGIEPQLASLNVVTTFPTGDTASAPADGSVGGYNAINLSSTCPTGYVAVGLQVTLGGTCNKQCDLDGRPVSTFALQCVPQFGKR